jgi:hypothetical protein
MGFGPAEGRTIPSVTVIVIVVPSNLFPLLNQICFFVKTFHYLFTEVFQ